MANPDRSPDREKLRRLINRLRAISLHLDELRATYGELEGQQELLFGEWARCCACRRPGPGLTWTADGRPVHRWPCRDRML